VATSILILALVAVLAPLGARAVAPWLRVPIVVFELVLGIVVGPSVLGLVEPSEFLERLSDFGLAVLFFVAGTEIDFAGIRGRPVRRALFGWVASIVLGVGIGLLIVPGEGAVIVAVALASTALGTLVPILRDAGEMTTPFGRAVSAIGAVGEFAPLVAISVFLGGREPGAATVVLLIFVVIAGAGIVLALRMPHGKIHAFVRSTLHTSGQFAVRIVILILAGLVALSIVLDIDMLIGAFAAGIIWRIMMREAPEVDREQVESKIEAVAFGLLVPVFFIMTGVTFDLAALFAQPLLLALVPAFLVALLITRGVPALWAAPEGSGFRDRAALGLFASTGLPIIVAVTAIGVDEELISSGLAATLVAAGMLSVLLFPLTAMALRGKSTVPASIPVGDDA